MYDDYYAEKLGAMHESLMDEMIDKFSTLKKEFEEYKNAMEWELGSDVCNKFLEQYRNRGQ